jgi:hypothetical protein
MQSAVRNVNFAGFQKSAPPNVAAGVALSGIDDDLAFSSHQAALIIS